MVDSQALKEQRAERLAQIPLHEQGQRDRWIPTLIRSCAEIWHRRNLLKLLVHRELRARYKDSKLGFAWSLFKPLSQLLIYYIVIGHFLGAARGIPGFAVFVFSGLTAWTLFQEIVTTGTGAIVANAGLVKKVYLPREIFPLAQVGNALINASIQFGILVLAIIVTGAYPPARNILYILPGFLVIVIFGFALALMLSALNVYLRDIQHLIEVLTFLMFWASPIVYSYTFVRTAVPGWLAEFYLANPVTLGILAFHRALWGAGANIPDASHLALRLLCALIASVVLLSISHRVFSRLEGNFAQEL